MVLGYSFAPVVGGLRPEAGQRRRNACALASTSGWDGLSGEARALDVAKRSVNCSARDFLAAWGRGKAAPVPCAGCSACCYYAGVPVDKKRDRSRLPRLLTERTTTVNWRSGGAQMEPALT